MAATRDAVREWRSKHPHATAAEMSRELGVSRERVRQILKSLGLPAKGIGARPRDPNGPAADCPAFGRRKGGVSRIQTGGVTVPLSTAVSGTIGELLTAADLTARGYTVYAPICRHVAHADLVALKRGAEDRPVTFEVRCGKRDERGKAVFSMNVRSKADHHAVVITGEPVIYRPALPE